MESGRRGRVLTKWALQGTVSEDTGAPVGNACKKEERKRKRGGSPPWPSEQFGLGVAGVGLQL